MRMVDIIEKKRDGLTLTDEEIRFFVRGYVDGTVPDYQASAFAMAVLFRGMDPRETATLTDAMMHSGETIDLSDIPGVKVDKHSTGGVGDKTSLVLGPLVASCGAKLAKMSGRGLGHTGGTLDKMESVPGMRIALKESEFKDQVKRIGIAIAGQTAELVPADKKLYALRDVTGTVESIPLIASSIMSKKLASGSHAILLDVKFGGGAFMKDIEQATVLARTMVEIGKNLGRDTRAILTDMDQPLGFAVGNAIEVIEAVNTLQGKGPKDLEELCIKAGGILLTQAGIVPDETEGEARIEEAIRSGKGFEKLREFFAAQGGDIRYLEDTSLFPKARFVHEVKATKEGHVERIDCLAVGLSAMRLGAGRATLADHIDMSAGVLLKKKVGDAVKKGDVLCLALTNKEGVEDVLKTLEGSFVLSEKEVAKKPIVRRVIGREI